jgi:hypothetical protein
MDGKNIHHLKLDCFVYRKQSTQSTLFELNHSNIDHPFSSSAANSRLKLCLKDLHLFDGETPHSSRSGSILDTTLCDKVCQ